MNKQQSQQLLEKHPDLEMFIEQGRFLTGYTSGGKAGETISIFLCHSPWTCNCIKATAGECIAAGEVIVISDDLPWSISDKWKAYSPNGGKQLVKHVAVEKPKGFALCEAVSVIDAAQV